MSDDSSEEDFALDWIPYSKRKEWADVTPVEQDDGENAVVVIAYSDRFKEVYDYFRAVLAANEKSPRALDLTRDALKLNAANYTVWQYRRDILKALNCNLHDELDYVDDVIGDYPKNYQVWHHRRVIVEWLNDASRELELTKSILAMDAKNYHAWQHRQWAIKEFNLFDDELNYIDKLISEDIRNNSAWNQRFFVLTQFGFSPETITRELQYTMNRIRIVKNNESAWNFLRGLLKKGGGGLDQYPQVVEFAEELYEKGVRSPYLIAFLIDLYEEKCLRQTELHRDILSQKLFSLCKQMCDEHDIIRRKYWQFIADRFSQRLKAIEEDKSSAEAKDSTI